MKHEADLPCSLYRTGENGTERHDNCILPPATRSSKDEKVQDHSMEDWEPARPWNHAAHIMLISIQVMSNIHWFQKEVILLHNPTADSLTKINWITSIALTSKKINSWSTSCTMDWSLHWNPTKYSLWDCWTHFNPMTPLLHWNQQLTSLPSAWSNVFSSSTNLWNQSYQRQECVHHFKESLLDPYCWTKLIRSI
jgi:hypothetical protein